MIAPLRQIPGTAPVPDEARVRASVGAIRAAADGDVAQTASLASVLLAEGEAGTESAEAVVARAMRKSGAETVSGVKTFALGIATGVVRGDVAVPMGAMAHVSMSYGGLSRLVRRSEVAGLIALGRKLRGMGQGVDYETVYWLFGKCDGIRVARRMLEDFEAKTGGMTLGDAWATLLSALVGGPVVSGVGEEPDSAVVEEMKNLLAQAVLDYIKARQEEPGEGGPYSPPEGDYSGNAPTIAGRILGLAARVAAVAREAGGCFPAVAVPTPESLGLEGGS